MTRPTHRATQVQHDHQPDAEELRGRIRFLLMCGYGWESFLIRTRSDIVNLYSHMACLLSDDSIVDARADIMKINGVVYPAGVQRRPAHYFWPQVRCDVYERAVPMAVQHAWETYNLVQARKGIPYDAEGILGFALNEPWWHTMWHRKGSAICSAYGISTLGIEHVNLVRFPSFIAPHEVDPNIGSLLLDTHHFTRKAYAQPSSPSPPSPTTKAA
jgi:hypothetical protein